MLSSANLNVTDTLRLFKSARLKVSFLVPTATGLGNSIMDATAEIREFMLLNGLHDYSKQGQGQDHKVLLNTTLLSQGRVEYTQTSLYRPSTKSGDPRIWIAGLKQFSSPHDLLAILASPNGIVAINCSQSELSSVLDPSGMYYKEILAPAVVTESEPAKELLEKMKEVAKLGYVQTKRMGDTGVGFTLETLLGIEANSSKSPDYKGIEIKSKRQRGGAGRRTTIFSQVPNWNLSRLKGSKELLDERGRYSEKKQRNQLFHELSVIKANSFDLRLQIDPSNDHLKQVWTAQEPYMMDVLWEFPLLKQRLSEKHQETFWVTAETDGKNGTETESFWYRNIKHTGGLDSTVFPILLELGVITLDYTIKETPSGGAKDQGYLFKMNSSDLDLLFEHVTEYDLAS
jgi:hypothetical protein